MLFFMLNEELSEQNKTNLYVVVRWKDEELVIHTFRIHHHASIRILN